jgi:hypothetical protein
VHAGTDPPILDRARTLLQDSDIARATLQVDGHTGCQEITW